MYQFSIVNRVSGPATVVDRKTLRTLVDNQKVAEICQQIAALVAQMADCKDEAARRELQDKISALKRGLPALCWHASFKNGKRNSFSAIPSGLAMIDVDHIDEPVKLFESVREAAIEIGLVAAHVTPSTKGLRMVFAMPEGMTIEGMQRWVTEKLGLQGVDGCTKDLARLSFVVPRGYWLYIDSEALFGGNSTFAPSGRGLSDGPITQGNALGYVLNAPSGRQHDATANGQNNGTNANAPSGRQHDATANGQNNGTNANALSGRQHDATANSQYNGTNANAPSGRQHDATANGQNNGTNATALKGQNNIAQGNALGGNDITPQTPCRGNTSPTSVVYEETYKGVPYTAIVDALETLYGGKPEHGNRNTQIFSMACMLRSICNDDPMWIAKILPTYGENEQRWMATIKSACSRNQVRNIPNLMLKAIDMAKRAVAQPEELANAGQTAIALDPNKPPRMPEKLPKLIRHLIKNVPEVCRPSVAHGVFPALATHLSEVNFRLIDGTKKEATFMCVNMARQSSGKASVNKPIEYIMADIKERDDINRRREQEWKDSVGTKGSNKEKPKRPDDLCVQMLVTDMTNAAFVQRLKDANGKYIYTNLEELDLLKQLQTNGTKDVGKIICLCFDNGTYGQERVGLQSITALLPLRWNWNASSTIEKGRDFFRNRLIDGTLSRVNFCTIINDESKEFKYGDYDEQYAAELKPYITNLNLCKGEVNCPQALTMAKRLQQKCTEIALQTEDIIYQEFAYRAVTIAYMKAMVLYIANDMTWEKSIDEFCEWSLDYDLWCKNYFFGEAIQDARNSSRPRKKSGRVNMLIHLPDLFTFADAQQMRRQANLDNEGTNRMLRVWVHRGYIIFNDDTEMYEKTDRYKSSAAVLRASREIA